MARRKRKRRSEADGLTGDDAQGPEQAKLTPVDVQQKVFRLAFRGYREHDVDEFLDQVTETLALLHEENKRLRESLNTGGGGASGGQTAAAEQRAAEIVRQAREHAARLVEEAERKAPSVEGQPAAPVPGSFLVRERAFLQQLASLVQSHARTLKDEARRVRDESSAPAAEPATSPQHAEPPQAGPPPGAEDVTAMPTEAPAGEGIETGPQVPPDRPEPGAPGEPFGPRAESPAVSSLRHAADAATSTAEPSEPAPAAQPGRPAPTARAFSTEAPAPEEGPTVPWQPEEPETPETPEDAGWTVEGSGEEGDPLLSAWESAFLTRPEEDRPADGATAPTPEPRRDEDRDSQEPSLRELFWGEE